MITYQYLHPYSVLLWRRYRGGVPSSLPREAPVENNNRGGEKVSESQAAMEHSSVAPPAPVKGSFALDERLALSLSLSIGHLNINVLP